MSHSLKKCIYTVIELLDFWCVFPNLDNNGNFLHYKSWSPFKRSLKNEGTKMKGTLASESIQIDVHTMTCTHVLSPMLKIG